jgi:hypothetical protein
VVTGGGHVSFETGVNILLTSRTLGSHKKGAQRPNNSSHEVASSKKPRRSQTFFDFHVSGFCKRRAQRFNLSTRELASCEQG